MLDLNSDEKPENQFKVPVQKQSTLKEMMGILQEKFKIPLDHQKIFKKCFTGMSNYCEQINHNYNLDKFLHSTGIYDGSVIYLEEADKNSLKSKWQHLFDLESKRCTIKFNNPKEKSDNKCIEFNCSANIDCDSTVGKLKELISKKIGIDVNEFIMKRAGSSSIELKDMQAKLIQANLNNYTLIHVELGTPIEANQHRVIFSLGFMNPEADNDGSCYNFYELLDIPVDDNILISELKTFIVDKTNCMYPTLALSVNQIRLRERTSERLSKILIDSDKLKNYVLYDRKQICVEVLSEPDEKEYSSSDLVILVKRWWPET